jgi:hypothetical protein
VGRRDRMVALLNLTTTVAFQVRRRGRAAEGA